MISGHRGGSRGGNRWVARIHRCRKFHARFLQAEGGLSEPKM